MAVFGVKTDYDIKALRFLKETKKRFKGIDLVKNPFTSSLRYSKNDDGDLITVIEMVPFWPNFPPYVAGLSLISILLIGGIIGRLNPLVFLFPLFISAFTFFWSSDFFFIVFAVGLKKSGYKGKLIKLKRKALNELLGRV